MKYLILGAGAAGLSFATRLKELGETSFLIVEKELEAGGLCRSTLVDGTALDIGGGHFLDTVRPKVTNFLFRFMPKDEWNMFSRNSQIEIAGVRIGHPFEAHIWQLPTNDQIRYLKSIATAGCNTGKPLPKLFIDWITWKLGDQISRDYMIPYNRKMFGDNLDQLGTYWLEKLPNVSFEDTLRSCLEKKMCGKEPGHTNFFYPKKYGYGELWRRMAAELREQIIYGEDVKYIDIAQKKIHTAGGDQYKADRIIVTIPWTEFSKFDGANNQFLSCIDNLKYTSVQIEYFNDDIQTDAHWIYYPDGNIPYHRSLIRSNFLSGSKGYWTETNASRINNTNRFHYLNRYAYPLNTIKKPESISYILSFAESNHIFGLGRWGEWSHYNSDVTVEKAINLAERLVK